MHNLCNLLFSQKFHVAKMKVMKSNLSLGQKMIWKTILWDIGPGWQALASMMPITIGITNVEQHLFQINIF